MKTELNRDFSSNSEFDFDLPFLLSFFFLPVQVMRDFVSFTPKEVQYSERLDRKYFINRARFVFID